MLLDGERLGAWLQEQHDTLLRTMPVIDADDVENALAYRMQGGEAAFKLLLNSLRNFETTSVTPRRQTSVTEIAPKVSRLVQKRDPETSWDAAVSQTPEKSRRLYVAISRFLQQVGPKNDSELAQFFEDRNFDFTPSGLRSRRKELVEAGWVRDSGSKRLSSAGAPSIVWEFVPEETP